MNTDIAVLGATENHKEIHHLGSFCLSLDNAVINNSKFITYWKKYRNSDVRPVVISRGEMALSKTLKKCVPSPDQFRAFYDVTWFSNLIADNNFINEASNYYRTSNLIPWPRPSLKAVFKKIQSDHTFVAPYLKTKNLICEKEKLNGIFYSDLDSIARTLKSQLNQTENGKLREKVFEAARLNIIENFSVESEIHQNNSLLFYAGMPIIKLDILYRGVFNVADVERLASQLDADEVENFKRLLYSRPFGANSLVGWDRLCFNAGIL